MKSIGIVGAGLSGVACAWSLRQKGCSVPITLFEKARGVGGRLSTRRGESALGLAGTLRFDLGAPFFTAKDPHFQKIVETLKLSGVVRQWSQGFPDDFGIGPEKIHPRYFCPAGANSLVKALLPENVELQTMSKVTSVGTETDNWILRTESGGSFSCGGLVLSSPVPQSLDLLSQVAELETFLKTAAAFAAYDPCFAVTFELHPRARSFLIEKAFPLMGNGGQHFFQHPVFDFVTEVQTKGLSQVPGLIVHTARSFSHRHLEAPKEQVLELVLEAIREHFGLSSADVQSPSIHLWRYSKPLRLSSTSRSPLASESANGPENLNERCFSSEKGDKRLVLVGDAFAGGRVEGAFLSGCAGADVLMQG